MRDAVRTLGPVFYFSRGYKDFHVAYAGRDAFSLFKNRLVDSSYMRRGASASCSAPASSRRTAPSTGTCGRP